MRLGMFNAANLRISAILIIALLLAPEPAASRSINHAGIEAHFDLIVAFLRKNVAPNLSAAEQAIFKDITFIPLHSTELVARGSVRDGKRIVEVSTGFSVVLMNILASQAHTELSFGGECGYQYLRFVFESIRKGYSSLDVALHPEELYKRDCSCHDFSLVRFNASRSGARLVESMFNMGMMFVLLHEVAHHVFGDTKSEASYSHDMEIAADEWAITTGLRARLDFSMAAPLFAYVLYNEQRHYSDKFPEKRFDSALLALRKALLDSDIFPKDMTRQMAQSLDGHRQRLKENVVERRTDEPNKCEKRVELDYEAAMQEWLRRSGMHGTSRK